MAWNALAAARLQFDGRCSPGLGVSCKLDCVRRGEQSIRHADSEFLSTLKHENVCSCWSY